jgi:4'-phosphopantetheinyl transferase
MHPRLARDAVHAWRAIGWEHDPAATEGLLGADDRQDAARLRFAADRAALLVRRAVLRSVLSRYVGTPAAALEFDRRCRHCGDASHGRPRVAVAPDEAAAFGDLSFSLSQAGPVTIIAVADGNEVGVDVETEERVRDWGPIARQFFTPRERQALAEVEPLRRRAAFLAVWTAKEACLKADGLGIVAGTDSVEVLLDPRQTEGPHRVGGSSWYLSTVRPGPSSVATIATTRRARVQGWDWAPQPGL